ncbi:hypothetical protein EWM64_g1012 [Hericium alpestre]|uniref:Polyketide synthase-like phosphopantetheine-binding domain-containing protein n=1 Tax=Hericium alpestre TaxID=135208 RepID=A0A4Z0A9H9_9AGAM|nr:hypothetical protein EWM64_g1012 [Hericium alpestre]
MFLNATHPLPPVPATQVLNSATFHAPSLDGTLSLPELYDWQLEHSPLHPLFTYADNDGSIKDILWKEAMQAIRRYATVACKTLGFDSPEILRSEPARPIVAILAASDSITYFTTAMGLAYAGFIPFPISPRNSPAAVAHLIKKTAATYVLIGIEDALRVLADNVMKLLKAEAADRPLPNISPAPLFEDLYNASVDDSDQALRAAKADWKSPFIILHSSGQISHQSTPIFWTHKHAIEIARTPYYGQRDLTGVRIGCHSMPMYHGMGSFLMAWSAAAGVVLAVFRPQSPAQQPTPDTVFSSIIASKSNLIFTVPSFVETWSKDEAYVSKMAELTGVMAGGGPLSKEVGDYLSSKGVNYINIYGCTEVGMFSLVIPSPAGSDWQYFSPAAYLNTAFIPNGDNKYELIIKMILVASKEKPFLYTAKNTPRRQRILQNYEEEIKQLFKSVDESAQSEVPPPAGWDNARTTQFVRTVVHRVLEKEISDDEDLFQHGCDSLQATWIRNTIIRVLREATDADATKIPNSFIYEHPYISSLASFLSSFVLGRKDVAKEGDKVAEMLAMVKKYTGDIPRHVPSMPYPYRDTVLLTGSTGGLGVHILAHLVADPAVMRIYAFNRKSSSKSLYDRQVEALRSRGLDEALVLSSKVVLVETDISRAKLDVSADLWNELQSLVTHIIHNAWRVDFKLSLQSFEANVKGLRNLLDFALLSPLARPPRLSFTSSIGIFHDVHVQGAIPETPIKPEAAVSYGYPESKWVGEKILEIFAQKSSVRPINIRVGQLGGGRNGAWTTAEWLPSLVRSSVYLGALPDCEGDISWIQGDLAAAAVVDMRDSPFNIVHLVHPRPVSWSNVFRHFSSALDLPLVPYTDWLARLDKSAEGVSPLTDTNDFKSNPALRLLDWFHSAWNDHGTGASEALGFPKLQTINAIKSSPMLADEHVARIGEKDVFQWVDYWKAVGFIPV